MSSADFFDVHSRGRVISQEARQAMRNNRKAIRAKDGKAAEAAPGGGPKVQQAVIKLATWGKSQRSAAQSVAYITRTRAADDPAGALTATNHKGMEIPPDQLRAVVEGWKLKPDADNLSPAAKAADPATRARMPEQERLKSRQVGHMILSIPAHSNATPEQVKDAAQAALHEIFAPRGVEYVFVVHTDHSARPHAHVVFKATTLGRVPLRIQPDDLRVMRHIFAEKATEAGIPLVATSREDRADLARGLEAGQVKARTSHSYFATKQDSSLSQIHWLARKAPTFYDRHGADYQRRLAGIEEAGRLDPLQGAHDLAAATVLSEPAPKAAPGDAANQNQPDPTPPAPVAAIDPLSPIALLDAVAAQSAVFTVAAIEREIAKHSRDQDQAKTALAAVLVTTDLVQLTPTPEHDKQPPAKFAMRAMIELENRMLDVAEAMNERPVHAVRDRTFADAVARFEKEAGYPLSDEQREAAGCLVAGGALKSVVGLPGTGKTTMLTAARMAWEEAGLEVRGAALAGIAADNLQQSGITSSTIAALLIRIEEQNDLKPLANAGVLREGASERLDQHLDAAIMRETDQAKREILEEWKAALSRDELSRDALDYAKSWAADKLRFAPLTDKTVLVIDEAGMVGSEQMTRLLEAVDAAGAKLVLVGDPEQIQPIELGGAFRAIFDATGGVNLVDVRRQREAWMRQATVDISEGRAEQAIKAYSDAGAIHAGLNTDRGATLAKLAGQVAMTDDDKSRVIVIIDYIESRRAAGAAFYLQKENPQDPAVARFAEFKDARDAAAKQIAADIELHRPWLARFAINGEHLAADMLVAEGEKRKKAIEKAESHAEGLGILAIEKSLDPAERLALDLRTGAKADLADAWLKDHQARPEASRIVLAHTNEDAADLNDRIRAGLKPIGVLTGEPVVAATEEGDREFMAGDRLLFRKTHRFDVDGEKIGVRNGTLGTVQDVGPNADGDITFRVKLDSGATVQFTTAEFDRIAPGYAVTTHKAQGVTVDRSFVLASVGMNKHLLGVAMSRHREETQVFAGTADAASPGQVAKIAGKAERAETTLDYLRETSAKPTPQERFADVRGIDPAEARQVAQRSDWASDRGQWIERQRHRLAQAWTAFRGQVQQRAEVTARPSTYAPPPVEFPALQARAQLELQKSFQGFADAGQARQRFLELYAEKAGLAVWSINNRPEVFGTLKPGTEKPPVFNPREAQISKSWRDEAARRLTQADPRAPIAARVVAQATKLAGNVAAGRRQERQAQHARTVARRAAERFGGLPGIAAPTLQAPTPAAPTEPKPGLWQRLRGARKPTAPPPSSAAAETPRPTTGQPTEAPWTERLTKPSAPEADKNKGRSPTTTGPEEVKDKPKPRRRGGPEVRD